MHRNDLLKKLMSEETLSPAEEGLLDEALESKSQQVMQAAVRSLPEDEASMTWRSSLNGRLLELGKSVDRRRKSLLIWRPAFGLGLAGALALVLTLKTQNVEVPRPESGPTVEATLLDEHLEAMRASELAGVGLASHEARPTPAMESDELFDWQRVDIETL